MKEDPVYYGDLHIEFGHREEGGLIGLGVTEIFVSKDLIAYGIYKWAREHGIEIPGQLSVVGYDDIASFDFLVQG